MEIFQQQNILNNVLKTIPLKFVVFPIREIHRTME